MTLEDSLMDQSFDAINRDLDRISETHPHLSRVWREYMKIKCLKFMKDMQSCNQMIGKTENIPDITPDQIIMTVNILNMVLTNNT